MFRILALAASLTLAMFEPASPPQNAATTTKPAHESDLPIPGVTNSGDAGSSIVEAIIDAPVSKVWWAFSTDEGFKSLGAAKAQIDFRVGGLIRSTYSSDGNLDDDHCIQNEIIAFDPERMLAIRIHKPPATFPFPNAWKNTWSVITMDPIGPDHTRLRLAMLGFTPDKESQDMKSFFDKGNASTLRHLKDRLGSDEIKQKTEKAWTLITSLVGDTWRGCATSSDGNKFCPKTVWTYGPQKKSVIFSIWFSEEPGTSPHIHQVISPEASSGTIVYTAVDDAGRVMNGHVTLIADDTVLMDWNTDLADGTKIRHVVTLKTDGKDAYSQRIYMSPEDVAQSKPWLDITFKRVAPTAPVDAKARSMIDTSLFVASGPVEPGVTAESVVNATPTDVFRAWTTTEGIKGFLDIDSNVDLRLGGPFELYFGGTDRPEGSRGSEGCQFLGYVPGRMISFSWNAPPKFPEERTRRTWVTILLTPVDGSKTRVELVQTGFGSDGHWKDVREYFASAWPRVLEALKEHFEPTTTGAATVR